MGSQRFQITDKNDLESFLSQYFKLFKHEKFCIYANFHSSSCKLPEQKRNYVSYPGLVKPSGYHVSTLQQPPQLLAHACARAGELGSWCQVAPRLRPDSRRRTCPALRAAGQAQWHLWAKLSRSRQGRVGLVPQPRSTRVGLPGTRTTAKGSSPP